MKRTEIMLTWLARAFGLAFVLGMLLLVRECVTTAEAQGPQVIQWWGQMAGYRDAAGGAAATPWYLSGGVPAENCVAAYLAKGAASQAASYTNLAGPGTNTLFEKDATTWSSDLGWSFTNANYLTNGPIPTFTWSAIIRYTNFVHNASGYNMLLGADSASTNRFYLNGRTNMTWGNGATFTVLNIWTNYGVMAIAGSNGYYQGLLRGSTAIGSVNNTRPSHVGAYNNIGQTTIAAVLPCKADVQAVAFYNTVLTSNQVLLIGNAMNEL